jgi:phosphoribosylglycinamide formyltransferase-1
MLALVEAVRAGRVPNAEIALVLSDRAEAAGLSLAAERGLETVVVERRGRSRAEHEQEILQRLRERDVEMICLAGFMRLLSPAFVAAYQGRILNVHPSLLPAFPGLDAQKQAVDYGVKWSGCTVHFVDDTLDGGPIIVQRVVPVNDTDTAETLAERILVEEHRAYPEALAVVVNRLYKTDGRRVVRSNR